MESVTPAILSEWSRAIHSRLLSQWEAWKNQNPAANDAVLANGFHAFCPDGTRREGRSSAE